MERHRTIDMSLRERRDILDLLERLKKEDLSPAEMDEIGSSLRKEGRRALSPLFRCLRRETDPEMIARYAALLEFFEDDAWLDQLVAITLARRDLDDEGKSALLSILNEYGVDVSSPLFAPITDRPGGLRLTLPRLLDRGERGLITFMEGLVTYTPEAQQAVVRELPFVDDRRVVELFRVLLGFDEPETLPTVIETLGRIRYPEAADLLRDFLAAAPDAYRAPAERSLRRLAFLGFVPAGEIPAPLPFEAAFTGTADASGYSCVMVARWTGPGIIDTLFMELHESEGMRDAWGWSGLSPEGLQALLREHHVEDTLVAVDPAFAVLLVRDAIQRSIGSGFYLPPEFYVRRSIFAEVDLTPVVYEPPFGEDEVAKACTPSRVAVGDDLIRDWFFDGWFIFNERVRLLADDLDRLEGDPFGRGDEAAVDRFLESWCRRYVAPRRERLVRRILLAADLMVRSGRERSLVEQSLAAARSIREELVPLHRQPFIRRWLLDLIEMVREARAEGYEFPPTRRDEEYEGEWD